jgi:hypothetical protein
VQDLATTHGDGGDGQQGESDEEFHFHFDLVWLTRVCLQTTHLPFIYLDFIGESSKNQFRASVSFQVSHILPLFFEFSE